MAAKARTFTTVNTVTRTRIELSRDDVVESLVQAGIIPQDAPDSLTVSMQVPGGADWCGLPLEVGTDGPLVIEWEQKAQTTKSE